MHKAVLYQFSKLHSFLIKQSGTRYKHVLFVKHSTLISAKCTYKIFFLFRKFSLASINKKMLNSIQGCFLFDNRNKDVLVTKYTYIVTDKTTLFKRLVQ